MSTSANRPAPLQSSEQSQHLTSFWVLESDEVYYHYPNRGTLSHDNARRFYEASEALAFAQDYLSGQWDAVEVLYTPAQPVRDPLDHYGF